MTLNNFALELAAFGLPLLNKLNDAQPAPPEPAILYLQVPESQAEALLAFDGFDPSHETDASPVAPGSEARRLLSRLLRAGLISAWHAFPDGEATAVHVQLTKIQAIEWYGWLDWQHKSINTGLGKTNLHTFA